MTSSKGSFSLIVATAAFVAMAAFMIWAFTQVGTLGLYSWGGVKHIILALCAVGIVPIVSAVAVRLLLRDAGKAYDAANAVCVAVSTLSLLVAVGTALVIFTNAYGDPAPADRPALIDPAKGFPLRAGTDGSPTFRVALSSDPHYGREASNASARSAILRLSQAEYDDGALDAFFDLGDTVEMGMKAADWREALESIRADSPTLPFVALLGNHDAMIGGYARWKAAFATSAGLSASSWRMDAGPVHFIALDLLWGPEGFGAKEKAWLQAQLESIPASDFIVVLSHCFFYSSGYVDEGTGMPWFDHADMLREVAPLIAGKADLVVSGHNHYMEWIEADGSSWAVVGAMGGKPDPVPTYVSPGSVWFKQGTFGRLVLELVPEGLACEFQDQTGTALFRKVLTN